MSQLANNARDALESVASGAIEAELENRVNEATDSVRNRINEELQDADPEIQQAAEALQNRLGF
jgi:gas vesicle protein